jgi:hypothetical protein
MIDLFNLSKPHNVHPHIALEKLSKTSNLKLCGFSWDDPVFEALRKQRPQVLPYVWGPQEIMGGLQLGAHVFVFYKNSGSNECQNVVVLPHCSLQNQFVPLDVSFVRPSEQTQGIEWLDMWAEGIHVGAIGTDYSDKHTPVARFDCSQEYLQQAIEYKTLHNTVVNCGTLSPGRKI